MTAVKICGVRELSTARACLEAGVDWIGLNFVEGSRRAIDLSTARAIGAVFPSERSLAVMRDATPEWLEAVLSALRPGGVQLHGSEPPELAEALLRRGLWVVKAIAVGDAPLSPLIAPYLGKVSALLFDASQPGSGRSFNWAKLAGLSEVCPRWLAGGLNAQNVAAAICEARPALVDTASGVEQDGQPDATRVAEFVRAAREARGR